MEAVRRFENWAAPFVLIVAVLLLVWMVIQAGGLGPIVEEHGTVGWGGDFWFGLFPPALMGMIAFWSTLSLNMPDFTRFGRSQREQVIGQAIGLPVTMTIFPLIAVLVTSATVVVYGEAIWNPVVLAGKITNPIISLFALFTLAVATLSVNVAANIVSPSYDFSNAWPSRISFRTGGLITGVDRRPHPALEPARLAGPLHLHVARLLRRCHGRHRRRPHRRLLARAADGDARWPTCTSRRACSGTRVAGTGAPSSPSRSGRSSPSAAPTRPRARTARSRSMGSSRSSSRCTTTAGWSASSPPSRSTRS